MSLKSLKILSIAGFYAALGCAGSDNAPDAASTCRLLCSKAKACGNASQTCVQQCERTPTLLQADAANHYNACVEQLAEQLDTCDDLERLRDVDCFGEAVGQPGCSDPGWAALAESACSKASCTAEQQAACVVAIEDIRDEVPCLSATALEQAVSCDVTCEADTASGGVTSSHSQIDCSYPA
jgi:hypothetical protein